MCAEGCRALPRSRFRHRGFAKPRNPRRGGWADGKAKELVRRLAGARCPALRSAGLFGSETGSPRTRVAFLRHGYLVAGVVGGPNPACGPHAKKSLRPQPQKRKRPLQEGPLPLKTTATRKKRQRASPCGGWSESRTRPADLTPFVPQRGKKSPRPVYAPQGYRPQNILPWESPSIKKGRPSPLCLGEGLCFSRRSSRPR